MKLLSYLLTYLPVVGGLSWVDCVCVVGRVGLGWVYMLMRWVGLG